jgi:hypothetical protein
MPSALRARLALIAVLGAFLIPIGMSSLRGLTHILTCEGQAETPFTLIIPPNGEAELLSSTLIQKDQDTTLCGGLTLNMGARAEGPGKVEMILPITNTSEFLWRGTVKVVLGGTSIPADIGEIPAGETRQDVLHFKLDEGAHELNGSLLIGP